jgi:GNAT superfamily N-acetyltransferase
MPAGVEVKPHTAAAPGLSRYLYTDVGKDWHWIDRLHWTPDQWQVYLQQPHIESWVAYLQGATAGYFELAIDSKYEVEIAYFGLLPRFIGRGLGGYLLTVAAERAWEISASRVWVHTSTRDHPHALANYQARGFRLFKQERL